MARVFFGTPTDQASYNALREVEGHLYAISQDIAINGFNGRELSPQLNGHISRYGVSTSDAISAYETARAAGTMTGPILAAACVSVCATADSKLCQLFPNMA